MTDQPIKRFRSHASLPRRQYQLSPRKIRGRSGQEQGFPTLPGRLYSLVGCRRPSLARQGWPSRWRQRRSVRTNADSYRQAGDTSCIVLRRRSLFRLCSDSIPRL